MIEGLLNHTSEDCVSSCEINATEELNSNAGTKRPQEHTRKKKLLTATMKSLLFVQLEEQACREKRY